MEELKMEIKEKNNLKDTNITNFDLNETIIFEHDNQKNIFFSEDLISKDNSLILDNQEKKITKKNIISLDIKEHIIKKEITKNKLLRATTIDNSEDLIIDSDLFRIIFQY